MLLESDILCKRSSREKHNLGEGALFMQFFFKFYFLIASP